MKKTPIIRVDGSKSYDESELTEEEKEFLEIAKDIAEGRKNPYTREWRDMFGKERVKRYQGNVFYSNIAQRTKHYTTSAKRDRAYDFVYDYLIEHGYNVHS